MTRNAASMRPDKIPPDVLLMPPEDETLDNPFITFDAKRTRKT